MHEQKAIKTLIATVGFPRSGKTTWALKQGLPIVNPDAIRLAIHGERFIGKAEPFVWLIAHTMVESLFKAGHEYVILDATNNTKKHRNEWQDKNFITLFKLINTDRKECLRRAENDEEIKPIIERMAETFEPLDEDESHWMKS